MANLKPNTNVKSSSQLFTLKGFWKFENELSDASENKNDLFPNENPSLIKDLKLSGAIKLDGSQQFLGTKSPARDTEGSYTVVAWVRLDSFAMKGKLSLQSGEHALTAVSQGTTTHRNFYLDLRKVDKEQQDGVLTSSRWSFTVSPIDSSETGVVDWQYAHTENDLNDSVLNGFYRECDSTARTASIYVPTANEKGTIHWPDDLVQLPVEKRLQVGREHWLGRDVDHWPEGPIKVFSAVIMSQEEVNRRFIQTVKFNIERLVTNSSYI